MSAVRPRLALPPILATLLHIPAAYAADAGEAVAGFGQMLLGLAVVVALLFATLWLLKRLAAPRGAAGSLKIIGAAPVGPRERVVLVEVADKVLVLGVAPGQVTALHSLDAAELPRTPVAGAAPDNAFQARLRQLLESRK